MKSPQDDELNAEFEQAWKRWSAQPPRQSPADAAAAVAFRIRQRPAMHRSNWYLAAAAVLLALVGTVVVWRPVRKTIQPQQETQQASLPLGKGEVLIWIDEQTPLYMTFQTPEEEGGK